jgi:hypothetical protein
MRSNKTLKKGTKQDGKAIARQSTLEHATGQTVKSMSLYLIISIFE